VIVAVCGTTNPVSNCAQQTTSYYKGQTYNGSAGNATAYMYTRLLTTHAR